MRSLPLNLSPGSDLRLSIEKVAQEQGANGFVLGVVGNLSRAAFQCPGNSEPTVLEGNLEIITLNGTLSPDGVHLHLSLSDAACQVWGGHLEPGTLVLKGADILLGFYLQEGNQISIDSLKTARLEIAVMPGCPWSNRALRLLQSSEIPFKKEIVDNDSSFQVFQKRSNNSTFPQIFIDGKFVGGYESLADLNSSGQLAELK